MTTGRVCAIHQPNLFPRLSTLAKLLAADIWVVLDDVQFNARDYQHRTRLAPLDQPTAAAWLTLPVHRPRGRASLVREVTLAESGSSARRLRQMPKQFFGRSPHWPEVAALLEAVAPLVQPGARLVDVAEASTTVMLRALGWSGQILRSSKFNVRAGRSERLADLVAAVGATKYLCGTGGAKYLDERPFAELGAAVLYVPPAREPRVEWNRLSALGMLARGFNDAKGVNLSELCDSR